MSQAKFLAVPEGRPIPFYDLPALLAKALFPAEVGNEDLMGVLQLSQEEPLRRAVMQGKLKVRNRNHMGEHEAPRGAALMDSVLLPHDLRPYLEDIGVELRVIPPRRKASDGSISYQVVSNVRLEPSTTWCGGILADADAVTLEEAARLASRHAGTEVTPADFLRAAASGRIQLMAVTRRAVKVRALRKDDEPINGTGDLPEGIPTLPLSACRQMANLGHASWRTFDGFEIRAEYGGELCRFVKWELEEYESSFETSLSDCRVKGYCVHALADAIRSQASESAAPPTAVNVPTNNHTDAAPDREPRSTTAPRLSTPKAVLIGAHAHEWPTIRGDIKDAQGNGLAAAAKSGARGWYESEALAWARAKGKLTNADKPVDTLSQAMRTWQGPPSRKHKLEG